MERTKIDEESAEQFRVTLRGIIMGICKETVMESDTFEVFNERYSGKFLLDKKGRFLGEITVSLDDSNNVIVVVSDQKFPVKILEDLLALGECNLLK